MFGSIDTWFYRTLGGINVDESAPGFERIDLNPYCHPEVGWVKCSLETIRGLLRSNWEIRGDSLRWDVTIPVNCSATLHIPASGIDAVSEGGASARNAEGVEFQRMEGSSAVFTVGSGDYRFVSHGVRDLLPKPFAARPAILPEETFVPLPGVVTVDMNCETEGATIRYTLDGSEPTEESTRFVRPFTLTESKRIRARAFKEGYLPSLFRTKAFTFVDPERNGLRYEYYPGAFTVLPEFDTLTPGKQGRVYEVGLSEIETSQEDYALRFIGRIEILEEGEYTFYTVSNDGSQLFVDGQLVVDNDGAHTSLEKSGKVSLTAGLHSLAVTYFQSGGGAELRALYEGPGVAKQAIPAPVLYRK